jgi:repressor LexA
MSSDKIDKLTTKDSEVLRHIRNTIVHTGKSPSVREIQALMRYKSPRSVSVILERLMDKGIVVKRGSRQLAILEDPEKHSFDASTVDVPIVGSASCGTPLLAEEHITARIPVSVALAKPPFRYFLLRANGDSMNSKGIEDGDLVLVRQQTTANNGDIVVALIDAEATVKRLRISKDAIMLEPCSTNPKHITIILQRDFQVQGVVVCCLGKLNMIAG